MQGIIQNINPPTLTTTWLVALEQSLLPLTIHGCGSDDGRRHKKLLTWPLIMLIARNTYLYFHDNGAVMTFENRFRLECLLNGSKTIEMK